MSQAGIVDIIGTHPEIPTMFVANVGTAVPIANTIELLGAAVAAHGVPLQTVASGNTVDFNIQYASAAGSSVAGNAGVASFSSSFFTVDANGFVSLSGGAFVESITVDTSSAPGTNPVVPNLSGSITVTGGQVAAGTTANVIRTDSLAANSYTIQIQRSQAVASSTVGDNGVSHFNSTYFSVDSNGFVSLVPSAVGGQFTVDTFTAPGTNPVVPNGSGIITVTGGQVAAGTTANVIRTDSLAANSYTIQIQRSQAVGVSTVGDNGVSHFNSTFFTVDSNGFVSLNGSGVGETITGNSGGALSPTAGNWNIFGAAVAAGTTPVATSGSVSTLTVNVQRAQAIGATNATNVGLAAFDSARFTVDGNGFVSINGSGIGETITGNTGGALSPTAGNWNILGTSTAAGTTPVQTSGTGSTLTVQVQKAQAIATTNATNVGLAAFDSARFSVDANGFVTINGTGVGETITGNTGGALSPTAGNWNILGTSTAAGTTPVQTSGSGSTLTVQVQKAQAIASTNATNVGLAAFDSARFSVDANGFVTINGSGVGETITGNSGGALSPTAGNWNILGASTAAGTTPVATAGSGSTLTVNVQKAQAIASTNATNVGLAAFNSAQFSVDANGFVSTTGAVATTYTENSGTATPSAGNLNVLGPNSALTGYSPWTTGSGATVTVNMPGTVKWVVNATSGLGTHTTIGAALTAASSGDDIFITPGSYTENLTLKAGVNLIAYDSDAQTPNVTIIGNATLSVAGKMSMTGIRLQTNSGNFLTVSGSAASQVVLRSCYLNCTNNTGISYSSSSGSSFIYCDNCRGDIGTTGIALFATSSAGGIFFNFCIITNSGGSSTASTNSGSGVCGLSYTYLAGAITTSSTALCGLSYAELDVVAQNVTALTLGGTGANSVIHSKIGSGTASAVSVGTGATCLFYHNEVNSSNTNAITGAGSISYSNVAFLSSAKINTTTQTGGVASGGLTQAPSAGFIGEQITANASTVSVSNATDTNITSISLTAGIWDVSGMCDFASGGAVTGTSFRLGINNTSATMPGNGGINQVSTPTAPNASTNSGLTVCPQRRTLTATTTVYLVCRANYTVGSVTVSGIITATRVG